MKLKYGVLIGAAVLALSVSAVVAQDNYPTVPADDPAAPFIDTQHVAVANGATAEWRKMEGVAYDPAKNVVYIAVTEVGKGMSDTEGDMQLPENPCGAVFMGELDENNSITKLTQAVVGGPYDESNTENPCSVDSISEPDNMFVDAVGNLWIGEDTGLHANNYLWMWDGTNLKRFAAVPAGAEVTGLRVLDNGTVFMNYQHPDDTNAAPFNHAMIGVVNGFKAGDDFDALPVPTGDAAQQVTLAAGEYQTLGTIGDTIPGSSDVFGEIKAADGSSMGVIENPDGNMYLPTNDDGSQGVLYTNIENQPGGVTKLNIAWNADSNSWDVVSGENVDFQSVNGTWNNCNASVTPWGTGLTSEEYPIEDADSWVDAAPAMDTYLGKTANPYDYGYIVELTPTADGTQVTKLFTLGRFSHEQAYVLPDQKTVYFGDDGTNRVLYKFVADNAGDLTAGTLYAAKLTQNDDMSFSVEWLELGHGVNNDLEAAVRALDANS